jgi:LuxR family transcriptional regulator, maltose regulon positive regulatory protein
VRDQTVPRERLAQRLGSGSGLRLSVLACPAGYGKTTLLAAWREAAAARKPVAWLTLDEGDNDPVVLWSYVIEALHRVCPAIGRSVSPEALGAAAIVDVVLPKLVNELDGQGEVALVLDDFHRLSAGSARDSVAWFIGHAPSTFQLVISTRTEPGLGLAALRAHGELLELRANDLRFRSEEAEAFLNGRLGLDLSAEDVEGLLGRTEGWPAGLYLAALSLQGAVDRHGLVSGFGVSSRHVVDFLVSEVLEAHDPPTRELMLRCSVLERLSGPLCDAVMEQEGSAAMLAALAKTNLFLVLLDEEGGWYRFHHLFARLLRMELEQRQPGLAPTLHRRASAWHRDKGTTDEAVRHAIAAGAYPEAAELIVTAWRSYINSCRHASVLAWLRQFPDEVRRADPHLLLIEAWVLSMSGKREEAVAAIAAAEPLCEQYTGPLPEGFSSVESGLTLLKALFPWGDVGAQLEHARLAAELEGPGSPMRALACWAMGMGLYFRGEFGLADPWFAESARVGPASGHWLLAGSSLAYRSLIAGEQGRPYEQRLLAEQAVQLAREHSGEDVDGEVPLALGVSLVARGRPAEARPLFERAVAVLRSFGQPIDLAMALLRQGALLRSLGEGASGEDAIAEARSILGSCPDPGILNERLAALERPAQWARRARVGTSLGDEELTRRELKVLNLLASKLTQREISRELFVSQNTVHSHIRSIYRKLGVSSRAEANALARQSGLL